jgi:putative ubiquitin-RnfH superfamily antitoxin RatB of RatAB toxin-antitoxin module
MAIDDVARVPKRVNIQVAYADADGEVIVDLAVAEGCTARDAIAQSGVLARVSVPQDDLGYAIFGRRIDADTPLAPGDRVEITRPLARDAKDARRARATR